MNKLYYTVNLHLDSSYSWNGLRTITGYKIGLSELNIKDLHLKLELVKIFELIAKTDGSWQYLLSDEEEIQMWLDDEGDKNDYEFIQL